MCSEWSGQHTLLRVWILLLGKGFSPSYKVGHEVGRRVCLLNGQEWQRPKSLPESPEFCILCYIIMKLAYNCNMNSL